MNIKLFQIVVVGFFFFILCISSCHSYRRCSAESKPQSTQQPPCLTETSTPSAIQPTPSESEIPQTPSQTSTPSAIQPTPSTSEIPPSQTSTPTFIPPSGSPSSSEIPPSQTSTPTFIPPSASNVPPSGTPSQTKNPLPSVSSSPITTKNGLSISGMDILFNDKPMKIWGVRVGSASQSQALTDQLIANLDIYKNLGVNTMIVYYMGTSGGYSDPFSSDGKSIDVAHQSRMEKIIDACASRNMIVIVGIFYQISNSVHLKDWTASVQAVATVADLLKKKNYTNVIINIANEQNSGTYGTLPWAGVNNPNKIFQMINAVKQVDPNRFVGAGGYDHNKNIIIGKNSVVDVLLFNTNGPEVSKDLFNRFVSKGVNKPMINVETFGAWTKNFLPPGVFPSSVKDTYTREVDDSIQSRGLGICFHSNPWYQGPSVDSSYPIRFDLGGMGTSQDPGVKWYFLYLNTHSTP